MKLSKIARHIINEDVLGNNVAAGGEVSPKPSPTAVQPSTQQPVGGVKLYPVAKDFKAFNDALKTSEEAAKKILLATLTKNLVGKKVKVNAALGTADQDKKDYDVSVARVGLTERNKNNLHVVTLTGTDNKEYYLNGESPQIQVMGPSDDVASGEPDKQTPQVSSVAPNPMTSSPMKRGQVGGIAHPQNMGISGRSPNFPG